VSWLVGTELALGAWALVEARLLGTAHRGAWLHRGFFWLLAVRVHFRPLGAREFARRMTPCVLGFSFAFTSPLLLWLAPRTTPALVAAALSMSALAALCMRPILMISYLVVSGVFGWMPVSDEDDGRGGPAASAHEFPLAG
jgi:hypothetical protein